MYTLIIPDASMLAICRCFGDNNRCLVGSGAYCGTVDLRTIGGRVGRAKQMRWTSRALPLNGNAEHDHGNSHHDASNAMFVPNVNVVVSESCGYLARDGNRVRLHDRQSLATLC
jgi:hypothetical protein